MYCGKCGMPLAFGKSECSICGYENNENNNRSNNKKSNKGLIIGLIMELVILLKYKSILIPYLELILLVLLIKAMLLPI